MRKFRGMLWAGALALAAFAATTPALADVGFGLGLNLGPPAYYGPYYHAPAPNYYYDGPRHYYFWPY